MRDLYLDYNRLTRLPDAAFRGTNAARLYLGSNRLAVVHDRAFQSLSSTLYLLDLQNNRLAHYPAALHHLKKVSPSPSSPCSMK